MKKQISIVVVDTCTSCPFLYSLYDDNPIYSGYFCKHPAVGNNDKIANEDADREYNDAKKMHLYNKKKNAEGLFLLFDETEPVNPFLIPDLCPLPNVEG